MLFLHVKARKRPWPTCWTELLISSLTVTWSLTKKTKKKNLYFIGTNVFLCRLFLLKVGQVTWERAGGRGHGSSPSAISAAAKPSVSYSWDCDLNSLSVLGCTCSDLSAAECRPAGKMWCRLCSGWHVIVPPQPPGLPLKQWESCQDWERARAYFKLIRKRWSEFLSSGRGRCITVVAIKWLRMCHLGKPKVL